MTLTNEEQEIQVIPKSTKLQFDWTINITTLIGLVAIIFSIVKYGGEAVVYLKDINAKTNVMWSYFAKDHPEAANIIKTINGDDK